MKLIGNAGHLTAQAYVDNSRLSIPTFHITIQKRLSADELAFEVLNQFYISQGKYGSVNAQIINNFKLTFLKEIPPPPLYFPIEIIESWFKNVLQTLIQESSDVHYLSLKDHGPEYS